MKFHKIEDAIDYGARNYLRPSVKKIHTTYGEYFEVVDEYDKV